MSSFVELFNQFAAGLKDMLPTSPFRPYINQFLDLPALAWLNWFFPVGDCLKVAAAWLMAIALFYLYSIVLRWLRAIGS